MRIFVEAFGLKIELGRAEVRTIEYEFVGTLRYEKGTPEYFKAREAQHDAEVAAEQAQRAEKRAQGEREIAAQADMDARIADAHAERDKAISALEYCRAERDLARSKLERRQALEN